GAAVFGFVGVEGERKTDIAEADGGRALDAEGAAEVEVAFGMDRAAAQLEVDRRGDSLEGDAGAGDQRLEQHVAGAGFEPAAAGRRVQAGLDQGAAGFDLAGDRAVGEVATRLQRDDRGFGIGAVFVLQRSLELAEAGAVHLRYLALATTSSGRPSPGRSSTPLRSSNSRSRQRASRGS